jgi:hypothetical protein
MFTAQKIHTPPSAVKRLFECVFSYFNARQHGSARTRKIDAGFTTRMIGDERRRIAAASIAQRRHRARGIPVAAR